MTNNVMYMYFDCFSFLTMTTNFTWRSNTRSIFKKNAIRIIKLFFFILILFVATTKGSVTKKIQEKKKIEKLIYVRYVGRCTFLTNKCLVFITMYRLLCNACILQF